MIILSFGTGQLLSLGGGGWENFGCVTIKFCKIHIPLLPPSLTVNSLPFPLRTNWPPPSHPPPPKKNDCSLRWSRWTTSRVSTYASCFRLIAWKLFLSLRGSSMSWQNVTLIKVMAEKCRHVRNSLRSCNFFTLQSNIKDWFRHHLCPVFFAIPICW